MKLERIDGVLDLDQYAALGDGRSVALVGLDGSIDWWCVPNLDSPPLFDQILRDDNPEAGRFRLAPVDPTYTVERRYLPDSNVLETTFTTAAGSARVTESLNSWLAGRLPWSELARRIEGVAGRVEFAATMVPGTRFDADKPERFEAPNGTAVQIGDVVATVRHDDRWRLPTWDGPRWSGTRVVEAGERAVVAVLAVQAEPLILPTIDEVDERIDLSDRAWREWTEKGMAYDGLYAASVRRSALALKLLIYSPTGSIAAAATMGLPERIGGAKNYDYRLTWIRDVCYTIKAFLRIGAQSEAKAAFAWILRTIRNNAPEIQVMYSLMGETSFKPVKVRWEGYRRSTPILLGNSARGQLQLGVYGDLMETAQALRREGAHPRRLDHATSSPDRRPVRPRLGQEGRRDVGAGDEPALHDVQGRVVARPRYGAQARPRRAPARGARRPLGTRARQDPGLHRHLLLVRGPPELHRVRRERHPRRRPPARHPVRLRPDGPPRPDPRSPSSSELCRGPLVYRYSGADREEGAFLACSFWLVEALRSLGHAAEARRTMDDLLALVETRNLGLLNEMADPDTGTLLGNLPQGLSHLALIHAALAVTDAERGTIGA